MTFQSTHRAQPSVVSALSLMLPVLLAGCALAPSATEAPTAVAGVRLAGHVHGGQQPVAGAALQLYAAGNSGYGSAYTYASGTSLLGSNTATTDGSGSFTITGDYTCPTATTPVYLIATGGNPGLPGNAVNANLALMAALGPCGQLSSSTAININELTTVAAVWALSPFMTGPANVGTTPGNAQGLLNAFATANKLVNVASGSIPGTTLPAGAVAPITKLNTLADIVANCINSAGGQAGDNTTCGALFAATTVGGIAPVDTITAAMNMAQNPTAQVATLTGMATPTAPFQPILASAPNDLNLVVSYTAGGLASPRAVAVDASGNVWVANTTGNTVTETDNSGALLSGASGYSVGALNAPSAIAVDESGNAWVANKGNNTVSKIAALGATASVYSGGSLNAPSSIAIDAYANAWIANSGSTSLTKITSSGTLTTYSTSGVTAPIGIALDPK